MNYELAKQLKEKGFSQDTLRAEDTFFDDELDEVIVVPSLSQLIGACALPMTYFSLEQHSNDWRAGFLSESWKKQKNIGFCSGSTPEEAVAKLWLELNEK